jgi:hypothetical protein
VTQAGTPPREVVRAPTRGASPVTSPVPRDLYEQDSYGATLLRSLMRAQLGAALSILVPAAGVLALYPLLVVLLPGLGTAQVAGVPLTLVVLGGAIYPPLVALGFWYVRRAEQVERRFEELLSDRD